MRFTVTHVTPDPNGTVELTEEFFNGKYELHPSGAIIITPDEGKKITMSPAHWLKVEEPQKKPQTPQKIR